MIDFTMFAEARLNTNQPTKVFQYSLVYLLLFFFTAEIHSKSNRDI